MPADPFTPAELDAAVAHVHELEEMTADHYLTVVEEARAALDAAAPLIAARVRAQVAEEEIAQAIEADADLMALDCLCGSRHADIARAHATTEEDPS